MLFRHKPVTALAVVLILCAIQTHGLFDAGFQSYLSKELGATVAKQLIRADLGVNGSFGGNIFSHQLNIYREPLILVHGLNGNASTLLPVRDFFNRQGYGIAEVYATSWGPDSKTVDSTSKIACSYVKQTRQLISAVSKYTGKARVNVVAYSLGSAVARKAILGGKCIDTGENLGSPLTSQINIFLSVAGSNLGTLECSSYPNSEICSSSNGLKANSDFLKDINKQSGYEGQARYSIGSKTDDIVGFSNLSLPNSHINVTLDNFNHGDTLMNTLNIQCSLLQKGYVSQRSIDKDAHAESQLIGKNCTGSQTGSENFQTGPHASQVNTENGDNFAGEYNRKANVYQFINGVNYTRHLNPSKGNFFSIRSKPFRG